MLILRVGEWNPDEVSFESGYCMFYKMAEMVALEPRTQVAGITCVVDGAGYGFKQFRNLNMDKRRMVINFVQVFNLPSVDRNVLYINVHFMQQGFFLWFREVHVINAPMLFNVAFSMIRPFLSESLKVRM